MSLSLREFHPFEAAGRRFLYLVPSAAVFALDDCSSAILDSLADGPRGADDLTRELSPRFDSAEVGDTIAELQRVRALGESSAKPCRFPDHSAGRCRCRRWSSTSPISAPGCTYCYE